MTGSLKPIINVSWSMSAGTEQSLEDRLNDVVAPNDIDLELGGRLRFTQPQFTEKRWEGEEANPADPILRETDNPTDYLTVHYQNGNYEWKEFNFRIEDGTAYLSSKMKVENPTNGHGWIPPEVDAVIQEHHPNLEVSSDYPPSWS